MKKMTEKALREAFSGESQAHMKYHIAAALAEEKGFKNVARLFQAIAYAEFVHARNHLEALGEAPKDLAEALRTAIGGETFEVEEMYPAYRAVAELQGEQGALRSIRLAEAAEKIHAELYRKALEAVEKGSDIEDAKIYVCPVCGYTVIGEAPDRCPICGAPKEKFKEF